MTEPSQEQIKRFPPGSKRAIKMGCTCAVIDNSYGLGGFDLPDGQFWVSANCPIHGHFRDKWKLSFTRTRGQ